MTPATTDEQSQFATILPEIEGRLDRGFACGPEEKEELIVIGVGHTFLLFLSATRRQKRVTPSTLAFYAKRMTRAGRQVGSTWRKYDALAPTAKHIPRPYSLDENDLAELLEDQRNGWPTVLDRVGFEMDWTDFVSGQSRRTQDIVGLLAKRHSRAEAAHAAGISRPAVTQRMARLKEGWEDLQEETVY